MARSTQWAWEAIWPRSFHLPHRMFIQNGMASLKRSKLNNKVKAKAISHTNRTALFALPPQVIQGTAYEHDCLSEVQGLPITGQSLATQEHEVSQATYRDRQMRTLGTTEHNSRPSGSYLAGSYSQDRSLAWLHKLAISLWRSRTPS